MNGYKQRPLNKNDRLRPLQNERGLGLVELMVTSLIVAGLVVAIMASYRSMPATTSRGHAELMLQEDASIAMQEMVEAVQDSASVTVTAADTLVTTQGTYTVSNGLLFKNGSEVLFGDYEFDQYSMQASSVNFVDNAPVPDTITITLTAVLREAAYDRDADAIQTQNIKTYTFRTQAFPRNR